MSSGPTRVAMTPRRYLMLLDRRRTPFLFEEVARRAPRLAELRPFGRRIWVASEPELARTILVDAGRSVAKGEGLRIVRMLLGNGLLTAAHDEHRRHRRLVQPAFSPDRVAAYSRIMVDAAQQTSARWRPGTTVDMTNEMAALTLDVVGRALLGDDMRPHADAITTALDTVLVQFPKGFLPGAMRLFRSNLPWAVRVREAIAALDGVVRGIMGRRGETGTDDVVSVLLATQRTDDALSDDQVRDEVMTLLLAGHETTANALTWAFWLLDRHPAAAERLRAEVAEVAGDGAPGHEDLPRLGFTTAVVAETLRLRPPAWMLEREVVGPLELDGHPVPVGTTLLASPWVLHRDPRWWPDPTAFRPQRWLGPDGGFDDTAPGQPRGAYLPFGGGSRVCIGASFAWSEAVLVLATLARSWAPSTVTDQRVMLRAAVTLRPAYGLRMTLRPAAGA